MKAADYNLIERYLDGTASAEELAVLDGRLRTDPALRLELIKEAGFEAQLRLLLRTAPLSVSDDVSDAEKIDVATSEAPERKVIRWRPAWLWIPVAAAAAALVAALLIPILGTSHGGVVAGTQKTSVKSVASSVDKHAYPVVVKDVVRSTKNKEAGAFTEKRTTVPIPAGGSEIGTESRLVLHPEKATTDDGATAKADPKFDPGVHVQDVRMSPPAPAPRTPAGVVVVAQPLGAPVPDPAKVSLSPVAAAVVTRADGQIVSANGTTYLSRTTPAGKSRHELLSGESFQSGDLLETGPMSGVFARYADGSTVRLYGNTLFAMGGGDNSRNLLLTCGAIDLRVQQLGAGSNLVVTTPHMQVRVVGTEFRVMSDDKGSWVGVRTGRVEVVRFGANGEVVQLNPGYFAASFRGWPPTPLSDPNWRSRCQQFTGSPKYP